MDIMLLRVLNHEIPLSVLKKQPLNLKQSHNAIEDLLDVVTEKDIIIHDLENKNINFQKENIDLQEKIDHLQNQNTILQNENESLKSKLAKNSTNSSKSPSTDRFPRSQRTRSERRASGRKPGGQKGHKPASIKKNSSPDFTINCKVENCQHCNRDLSEVETFALTEKQVIDLPEVKPTVTTFKIESKICPDCHAKTQAQSEPFLDGPAEVRYGPRVQSIAVFLMVHDRLPYSRTSKLLKELYQCDVSEGTLSLWLNKAGTSLQPEYKKIADALTSQTGAVHFDETGININKKNYWMHTVSNNQLTFFGIHLKRGKEAMEEIGILPRFHGVAIHDRWSPYFRYTGCKHGLCGAHLCRDLRFIFEEKKESWAGEMRSFLYDTNDQVKKQKANQKGSFSNLKIKSIEKEYDQILKKGFEYHKLRDKKIRGSPNNSSKRGRRKQSAGKNLLDALEKYKDFVLLFVHDFSVPFTNNQAERDHRMEKVKLKISGCFRSLNGAKNEAYINTYLSTAMKQSYNGFTALYAVFNKNPLVLV